MPNRNQSNPLSPQQAVVNDLGIIEREGAIGSAAKTDVAHTLGETASGSPFGQDRQ
jgi:hypothetical protein